MMLINPLGPPAPVVPQGASPYYPTTRRFRNPLYLRVEDVPRAHGLGLQLAQLAAEARGLNALPQLDRDRVFHLKQQALRAIWGEGAVDGEFTTFRREQGMSLERFATFCALAEKFGPDWRTWPAEYRQPDHAAVARFAATHFREVGYHAWLQWLLDRQLAEASRALPNPARLADRHRSPAAPTHGSGKTCWPRRWLSAPRQMRSMPTARTGNYRPLSSQTSRSRL